jgi:P pilus assembly chaperone PapD
MGIKMKMRILPFTIFCILSLFVFLLNDINAQVVVTPYVVLIDKNNKFGTYSVINETSQPQEVSIAFKFGYPVSDSKGNVTMKFVDTLTPDMPSLNKWIKVFPRKFTLSPKQRQIVRMTIQAPSGTKPGTYWTRIITSSQTKQNITDTTGGFKATINFVLNQSTTVLYSHGKWEPSIEFNNAKIDVDSNVNIYSSLTATGDNPFYAKIGYRILDSSGKEVKEEHEYLGIYFSLIRRYSIPVTALKPGNYTAEIKISSDDNPDIPKGDKGSIIPLIKKIDFTVP